MAAVATSQTWLVSWPRNRTKRRQGRWALAHWPRGVRGGPPGPSPAAPSRIQLVSPPDPQAALSRLARPLRGWRTRTGTVRAALSHALDVLLGLLRDTVPLPAVTQQECRAKAC